MPKAGDEAGTKAFWERLGAPKDAAGYDFSDIKTADGKPALPDTLAATLRETFAKANVPLTVAKEVAAALAKHDQSSALARQAETAAALAAQSAELARNWGVNAEANKFVARRAAEALGVDAATMDTLEGQVGGAKVMEMFRKIGSQLGEDNLIRSGSGGGGGIMTREAAMARRAELMADKTWVEAYLKGDAAKNREMQGLLTLVHGDDTRDSMNF